MPEDDCVLTEDYYPLPENRYLQPEDHCEVPEDDDALPEDNRGVSEDHHALSEDRCGLPEDDRSLSENHFGLSENHRALLEVCLDDFTTCATFFENLSYSVVDGMLSLVLFFAFTGFDTGLFLNIRFCFDGAKIDVFLTRFID